ncbi:MAG: hypothetical protein AAGU18_11000 [Proteiniphilum sp.]
MSPVKLNIEKLFADSFFRHTIHSEIEEINSRINGIRSKIIDSSLLGNRLKRSPVDRLSDSGDWSVDGLIKVYTEYYITRTAYYPTAVRKFVSSMILSAADKTLAYYKMRSLKQPQI